MAINKVNVQKAVRLIGAKHTKVVVRLAEKQDRIERKWEHELKDLHAEIVGEITNQLREKGRISIKSDLFERFLLAHYFQVVGLAVESTEIETEAIIPEARLAKRPTLTVPRSLRELRELYDRYRKTGQLPRKFKDQAEKIKKQYLKKTQSVWRKYSDDFRAGNAFTQKAVVEKVKEAADTVQSRAKTIIRTETTNYYNQTRKEIYDQSDAIWGYLFLAIRDQGTTKWCTDKTTKGKRGRHGLVYKKGDPLTTKETPSCHWNCRSEMVPLTIYNPRHRKLIEDLSLHRRNHVCHPLPVGWR